MKWEMEVLSPTPYLPSNSWSLEDGRTTRWTPAENKLFENALAVYDKDTPDRWQKVADMIPGKTVSDVIKQYRELEVDVGKIEAGLIPIPGYGASTPFTLDWLDSHDYDGFRPGYGVNGKRSLSGRPAEQERKKGVPWTEEEHKLFLMGLKKYGKGDWRNISRNFVITRTPTQVASHAQKYFIRQLSGGKDKRRSSIHDITTVNIDETRTQSPDSNSRPSPEQSSFLSHQSSSASSAPRTHFLWNNPGNGSAEPFGSSGGNVFTYGVQPYELKVQGQNEHRAAAHEPYFGSQNLAFQMQSRQQQHHHHG